MKRIIIYLIILQTISIDTNAQNVGTIDQLLRKVEEIQKQESLASKITSKKRSSNRVFKISIEMDSLKNKCVRKIKYYKGGLKKERIKYYHIQQNFMFLEIVRINDKIEYIKYKDTIIDYSGKVKVKSIEIFMDNKFYKKMKVDNFNKTIEEKYIIITENEKIACNRIDSQ